MVKLYPGDSEYEIAANINVEEYRPAVPDYAPIATTFYRTIAPIRAFHGFPINLTSHIFLNAFATPARQ